MWGIMQNHPETRKEEQENLFEGETVRKLMAITLCDGEGVSGALTMCQDLSLTEHPF
jgi:hypothetical protein